MKKDGGRIEDEPTVAEAASGITTEFHGGEGEAVDDVVMEEVEEGDAVRPETWLNLPDLLSLLVRKDEVEAAKRKGRKNNSYADEALRRCFSLGLAHPSSQQRRGSVGIAVGLQWCTPCSGHSASAVPGRRHATNEKRPTRRHGPRRLYSGGSVAQPAPITKFREEGC